jgi:hypothetical protein
MTTIINGTSSAITFPDATVQNSAGLTAGGTIASGTVTTLTTTTISDGTNSTSATNAIQGSAKAWCNYNGTAGTIRGSYNIASVTKNSAGNYTFNFTNAMPNTNYSVVTTGGEKTIAWGIPMFAVGTPITTTSVRFTYQTPADVSGDTAFIAMVVFSS